MLRHFTFIQLRDRSPFAPTYSFINRMLASFPWSKETLKSLLSIYSFASDSDQSSRHCEWLYVPNFMKDSLCFHEVIIHSIMPFCRQDHWHTEKSFSWLHSQGYNAVCLTQLYTLLTMRLHCLSCASHPNTVGLLSFMIYCPITLSCVIPSIT